MRVVAKLKSTAPLAESAERTQLAAEVSRSIGVELRLLRGESSDLFVEAHATDAKSAGELAARLRKSPHIDSAYVKPDPQAP